MSDPQYKCGYCPAHPGPDEGVYVMTNEFEDGCRVAQWTCRPCVRLLGLPWWTGAEIMAGASPHRSDDA